MFARTTQLEIQFGDCDPAGIVYYPNYFRFFDNASAGLLSAALGMHKRDWLERYGSAGIPMVDTGARFARPCRFGDVVEIHSQITELGRSSLGIRHRLVQAGETAIVLADAVSVLASESSARLGAGGDLGVAASGALLVRGGAAEGASASIYSGSGDFILSARGITLAGGAGHYASAVLSGNPDVDLTLAAGSSLVLVPGTGEFASARVDAFLPTTILLDLRGNPVGGFSVAGVAGSVFHEPSGSGLFANGSPAIRGDSLKVFLNGIPEGQQGSTPPPIDPASLVLAALAQGGVSGAQGQPAGGSQGPDTGSGVSETSTEEGTTILLLRPRPPAQCN